MEDVPFYIGTGHYCNIFSYNLAEAIYDTVRIAEWNGRITHEM
jgi:hypothetical protein